MHCISNRWENLHIKTQNENAPACVKAVLEIFLAPICVCVCVRLIYEFNSTPEPQLLMIDGVKCATSSR